MNVAINFSNFLHGRRSWNKLYEHQPLGVAPIVREYYTNLWDKIGSRVFVLGILVPFDGSTINGLFWLNDEDRRIQGIIQGTQL